MTKKIKVMMLIQSLNSGGAQQIAINYLRDFMNDEKIELTLFVYDYKKVNSNYDKIVNEENLNVIYLNVKQTKIKIPILNKIIEKKRAEKKWFQAIKEYNPDIIHIHIVDLIWKTLRPIRKLNKEIVFVHLHSQPNRLKGLKLYVVRKCFKKYGFIPIAVTNEVGNASNRYFGSKSYIMIYNGLDFKKINNNIIKKETARNILNINKDIFVILGVGRLNKIKRFDLLINIFNEFNKNNNNSMLIIVGGGQEYANLKNLINNLNLEGKVILAGNQSDVIPYYCASDVMMITSKSESSALVLLEAQLCKLKCIISSGVPSESIISNRVVKINDDDCISEWIDAIKSDKFYTKPLNKEKSFDTHEISKKLKDLYLQKYYESMEKINDKKN